MIGFARHSLFIIILLLFHIFIYAQVTQSDLLPQLTPKTQIKVKKANELMAKGLSIVAEAEKLRNVGINDKEKSKNEKKYTLKRLEADQYLSKAYLDLYNIFKDNTELFWKKNPENNKIPATITNNEDKAQELFRKARALRRVAEDLAFPEEKIGKIIEAEGNEQEMVDKMVKVLYAYLNNPVGYNELKKNPADEAVEILTSQKQDSIPEPPKDSIAEKVVEHKVSIDTTEKQNKEPLSIETTGIKKDTLVVNNSKTTLYKENISETKVLDTKPELIKTAVDTMPKQQIQQVNIPKDTVVVPDKEETIAKDQGPAVVKLKKRAAQESLAPGDTGSLYDMVKINEGQVDMFNKFLESEYPKDYEHYIIDFQKLDYSNVDSMKSAWYKYLYAGQLQQENVVKDSLSLSDSIQMAQNGGVVQKDNKNSKGSKSGNGVKGVKNTETDEWVGEPAKGFIFRVQIAACRIPIDDKSIKAIYNGEQNVLQLQEDNWNKYAIGEFITYRQARKLRDAIHVPGAFVIAYLNGKRIKILKNMTGATAKEIKSVENVQVEGLNFKVQIAASKKTLNQKYIRNIYSGNSQVEEYLEEEWYKYGISFKSDLKSAKNFVEKENIPGAFITAYYENKKIELKEALRLLRKSHN